MHTFENILVVPVTRLVRQEKDGHVGGPVWPDWADDAPYRFRRRGVPADRAPSRVPAAYTVRDDAAFWIGPLDDSFGHTIADFTTRIAGTLAANASATLVFASHAGHPVGTLAKTPQWFRDLLAWYGVGASRVRIVDRPTHFRRLSVCPQGEQLFGPPPTVAYLDLLTSNARRNLGVGTKTTPVLYVSRAGQRHRFAGETYLERLLGESERVSVIRPETMTLRAQLEAYYAARRLIFAEGSAVHGLQLLGRDLGEVVVVNRRPGMRIAEDALAPRCASLAYRDLTRGLVCVRNDRGQALRHSGMAVLDTDQLAAFVDELGLGLGVDRDAFETAVDADLVDWLRYTAGNHAGNGLDHRRQLMRKFAEVGRAHLATEIERLFA